MCLRIMTFLFYGAGVVWCSHNVTYEFQLIDGAKNWSEAQSYCRQHYTDLATFESLEDVKRVKRPGWYRNHAWIGLSDDPGSWKGVMSNESNSWRWSATGTTSPGGYQHWASGQPDYNAGRQTCVTIAKGRWYDSSCLSRCRFACFTGSPEPGMKKYTLVNLLRTQEQAQSHCRKHYTDLAMIQSDSENNAVASLEPGSHVWTGLYREPWRWSDGSESHFKHWLSGHPNNYRRTEHCIIEHKYHKWNDANCSGRRPFICQGFASKKSVVSLKLRSGTDLSETANHNQILQQIELGLVLMGTSDINLKWKSPPKPENGFSLKMKSR